MQFSQAKEKMIAPDYQLNARRSPLTDPWEPIFWRESSDAIQFAVQIRQAHCNARGFAHGGLISSLADNAMGRSAVLQAKRIANADKASALTVSLNVDYIDSAQLEEWLEFHPTVLKVGRTLAFVECKILVNDRLVARADASFRMLQ